MSVSLIWINPVVFGDFASPFVGRFSKRSDNLSHASGPYQTTKQGGGADRCPQTAWVHRAPRQNPDFARSMGLCYPAEAHMAGDKRAFRTGRQAVQTVEPMFEPGGRLVHEFPTLEYALRLLARDGDPDIVDFDFIFHGRDYTRLVVPMAMGGRLFVAWARFSNGTPARPSERVWVLDHPR